jgi:hypothetical protein
VAGGFAGKALVSKGFAGKALVSKALASKSGLLAGVTYDVLGDRYFPASAAEWAIVMAAAGVLVGGSPPTPLGVYNFQEASGTIADAVGVATLSVAPVPTYQAAIPGFSRVGVSVPSGGTQVMSSTDASLPIVSTTSMLTIAMLTFTTAPAAIRGVMAMGVGGATQVGVGLQTTGKLTFSGTAPPVPANTVTGGSHLVAMRHNVTALADHFFTEQEKSVATYLATAAGRAITFGACLTVLTPAMIYGWATTFAGLNAELTDAQLRAIYRTLRWPDGAW